MSKHETHKTLYHFTAVETWPAIRTSGLIALSNPVIITKPGRVMASGLQMPDAEFARLPGVVWLTESDEAARQEGWAHKSAHYRAAVRIAVRVPLYTIAPFVQAAKAGAMPGPIYDMLKGYGPQGEYLRWWWCNRAIPKAEWLDATLVTERLRLYTAGTHQRRTP